MEHLVSDDDFNQLRGRWLKTLPKHVDTRISAALNKFNQVKGVVTVFSCSGHTKEELLSNPQLSDDNDVQVIFAINEEGQDFIKSYIEWLDKLSVDKWLFMRPKLSLIKLAWPLRVNGPKFKMYNAYELTFEYNREQHGPDYANQSINDLLAYHFRKK